MAIVVMGTLGRDFDGNAWWGGYGGEMDTFGNGHSLIVILLV